MDQMVFLLFLALYIHTLASKDSFWGWEMVFRQCTH